MFDILVSLGNRDCTFHHDKIFSLLYLTDSLIKPDYAIGLGQLYIQVLCEGLVTLDSAQTEDHSNPLLSLLMAFINSALAACSLEMNQAAVNLVTCTALQTMGIDTSSSADIVEHAWAMRDYTRLESVKNPNAEKPKKEDYIEVAKNELNNGRHELAKAKSSGLPLDMSDFRDKLDGSPGEASIESYTYDEWVKLTKDTYGMLQDRMQRKSAREDRRRKR